jgi:hypothetical protein
MELHSLMVHEGMPALWVTISPRDHENPLFYFEHNKDKIEKLVHGLFDPKSRQISLQKTVSHKYKLFMILSQQFFGN